MRGLSLPFVVVAAGCAAAADPPDEDFPDAGSSSIDARPLAHIDAAPHEDAADSPDAAPADAAPCTGGVMAAVDQTTGHCYVLFTSSTSWSEAEGVCRGGFGHLASITSQPENTFVQALVGSRNVWIGATDATSEGVFAWSTGEPFTFSTWESGQPDNGSGSEDCVLMRGGSGRWNDDQCGNGHGSVCERE